jgi:hypothetical protein
MIYQFCFFFPVEGGWYWFVIVAYCLHVHWFWCWVRSMRKRLVRLEQERQSKSLTDGTNNDGSKLEKEDAFKSRRSAKWPIRPRRSDDSGVLLMDDTEPLVDDDDDELDDVDSGENLDGEEDESENATIADESRLRALRKRK